MAADGDKCPDAAQLKSKTVNPRINGGWPFHAVISKKEGQTSDRDQCQRLK